MTLHMLAVEITYLKKIEISEETNMFFLMKISLFFSSSASTEYSN